MNVLTTFYGMDFATDKLRSLVKKWTTLIEATTDGYKLRLFCIGFTKRRPNQNRKTSYAQSAQVRNIRRKMIGGVIEKATQGIYPLQNCLIRKVKVLRAPKTD